MSIVQRIKACFKPRWVYRSSITGKFVSKAFAEANPDTTYRSAR
jgi:hypothetical protein